MVLAELHVGRKHPDCLEQDEAEGLLQEYYAMTQKHNESMGKYAVRLDISAGKVWLQSQEVLGSNPDEWERLLVNHLLHNMNPKL